MKNIRKLVMLLVGLFALALPGCGGGDNKIATVNNTVNEKVTQEEEVGWAAGVYEDEANYLNYCAAPRSGTDPVTGISYPDMQGTALTENNWLRSWSNNTYLWYDEIFDRDPALYTTATYFDLLKTFATTSSGTPKDQFHFTYPTEEWEQLSQSGVSAGYGAEWAIIKAIPPREVRVAFTEPGSPATSVSIARGTEILKVDNVDVVNANDQASIDMLNAAFFPAEANETHTFVVRDLGSDVTRTVTMTSTLITSTPVQNVRTIATAAGTVGYILFNSHIATAEEGLIAAVTELSVAGISDLVLDLRYNGGGLLAIASQLAYMIAGPTATSGKTFENMVFNDKHPASDPVTGSPLSPTPFYDTSVGFSVPEGQALPTLNLNRVFILSQGGTCSASEAIINGLRGIDVEVVLIGSTTCGKPYGFYPTPNCGTTYFTIQLKGENNKGYGDYTDGFKPYNTVGTIGEAVPGCSVADDFLHLLGDNDEGQLAAALNYRDTSLCPAPTGSAVSAYSVSMMARSASLFQSDLYRRRPLIGRIISPSR
ncbi:MAG: S41 family peptidase [Desulfurivibrionaceae bacterium]